MTHREMQLVEAIETCRKVSRALNEESARLRRENAELEEANLNLRVERDATDELLGAAMDAALSRQEKRP